MVQSTEEPLDEAGWKDLFIEYGIKEAKATVYGQKFVAEEMSVEMLPQLNRDILREMGVTIIGDALAILSMS